ncbi:MAG: ABC transporter permease [Butyrivibrio sp.]|nr:ABC transporter permease [Butyrivibrio sp.]
MGKLGEYFKSAIKQIVGNGYRTLMTMLGIIVGIAAVIAVVALGNGMTQFVQSELNGIAGNYGEIYVDSSKTAEKITHDDIEYIESNVTDIYGVSPQMSAYGKVTGNRGTYEANVMGGSTAMEHMLSNGIIKGKYFNKQQVDSSQRVCVMLRDDAKKIFGTEEALGMEIELTIWGKTATYKVIGLRDSMNRLYSFIMEGQDYSAQIEVPYTALAADFDYYMEDFYSILLFADQGVLNTKVDEVKEILTNRHGLRGTKAITAYSMADFSGELDQILGYATTFLLLVSVISLVVGGIGVMNIMLVSVTERTREIGIRKSIGAKTGAIMVQFLSEAAILTLLGGIIGILVGIGMAYLICTAIGFKVIVTPTSVIGAALFSILIGLFFGLYPARKAAKMKPIDALRL